MRDMHDLIEEGLKKMEEDDDKNLVVVDTFAVSDETVQIYYDSKALIKEAIERLEKATFLRKKFWVEVEEETEIYSSRMRLNDTDYDKPVIEILEERKDEE